MPGGLTWLAGAAVLAAGGGWGALVSRQLTRRPLDLAAAAAGLEVLRTEIAYARTPLPQALRRAAAGSSGPAAGLMREVAAGLDSGQRADPGDAWARALAAADGRSAWTDADVAALERLGHALGRSDAGEQTRHIALCVERLRQLEAEARAGAERQGRMWRYLGVLLGAALVLMVR
jgi:stage III sporulation protein AB